MRAPLRPRDLMAIALVSVFALSASGTHVVRSGDTLSGIAKQNGTTVRALVEANGIADRHLIVVGQKIKIPAGGSGGGGSAASTTTYVVRRGDTLSGIATKFRTSSAAIARANGIADPNSIRIGARLTVAGGGGSSGGGGGGGGSTSSGRQLSGQRHTVRAGDTIYGIASRYGISQADFVRWNGLVDGKLYATTSLVLYNPGTLPGASAATGPVTHVVRSGETLGAIATKYGTTSAAIANASNLPNVNTIRVGQRLTIPGGSGSSSVRCPVPGGTYFNDWGFPRSGGRAHAGNDIFAPRGTPVHAPVSGWVDVATGAIGGHQFRLRAPDGTLWFGSHMDRFGKKGAVAAGDVIGYVGDSGNARGGRPHLHFEIHPGSQAVNPYPLLRRAC
jgi:LysM repeat protein